MIYRARRGLLRTICSISAVLESSECHADSMQPMNGGCNELSDHAVIARALITQINRSRACVFLRDIACFHQTDAYN